MTINGEVGSFFAIDPNVQLRSEILDFIMARYSNTPRHLQKELGPSEIGHPCSRRLAYGITAVPRSNPQFDPLPSIIGTATHTWLESAAVLANTELGRDRWLTETKVNVADGLSGSCDLYDTDTDTVIDYKVPGVNQFSILKKAMSATYRVQTHLYGKGFANAGRNVKTVAVLLIPRGGTLAGSHMWSEPYDEAIVNEALERRNRVIRQVKQFDVAAHPERYEWFAKSGYQCMFCPNFSPVPNGPLQCSGVDVPPPLS